MDTLYEVSLTVMVIPDASVLLLCKFKNTYFQYSSVNKYIFAEYHRRLSLMLFTSCYLPSSLVIWLEHMILTKSILNDIFEYICTISHVAFLDINLHHNDVVIHYLSSLFVCLEHTQTLSGCSRAELKS